MRRLVLMAASLVGTCAASPWNMGELAKVPGHSRAPDYDKGEVKAVFIEGLPWKGRPTRFFAYYGIPSNSGREDAPAMVLVHGGGGSAFSEWVRLWMDRGYAAIAMDTCGAVSGEGYRNHRRHDDGGPPGWGGFDQISGPLEDQWTYHAVADVILAHSWMRARDGVDEKRTGITGISWGGYLTCIVAGVDDRFRFAAPVYGCGHLTGNSAWLEAFGKMSLELRERWESTWDPSVYLSKARMPLLWVTGTNDFAFPMDSLQRSYRLPEGERYLAIRPRMPHGHGGAGEKPEEIRVMAEAVLGNGAPLMRVVDGGRDGKTVSAKFSGGKAVSAVLNYTVADGVWKDRLWQDVPAEAGDGTVTATLPEGTKVYYFNVTDDRGLVASSEHQTL